MDTRRLDESFHAIDRLEQHGTPFIVARNNFGEQDHSSEVSASEDFRF